LFVTSSDPKSLDVSIVGGKSKNLSLLQLKGYPVPPFSTLSSGVFDLFMQYVNWEQTYPKDQKIDFTETSLHFKDMREKIQKLIIENPSDSPIVSSVTEIWNHAQKNKVTLLAIRSSALEEDSVQSSHAGLLTSILGVVTLEKAIEAVYIIYSSLFSEALLSYRHQKGLSLAPQGCAIVFQQLIESNIAGVLFTANPETGDRSCAYIEANYGIGESVVASLFPVDRFHLPLNQGQPRSEIAEKTFCLKYAGSDAKLMQSAIPANQQKTACLSAVQLEKLRQLALTLITQFHIPQDCEWAFDQNQQLYLLQTRPISTLVALQAPLGESITWDNSNIQESYNGVTTPLTFSVASKAYASVYEQTARLAGAPEYLLEKARPFFRNMLGYVHGRIYYNINNWYRCLLYTPSFRYSKSDMERMMGVEQSVDFVEDQHLDWREKLNRFPLILHAFIKLIRRFLGLKKESVRFLEETNAILAKYSNMQVHALNDVRLIKAFEELNQEMLKRWDTPIINDCFVMIMNGFLHRVLEKSGLTQKESQVGELMRVRGHISSLNSAKHIYSIAEAIHKHPELKAWMMENTFSDHTELASILLFSKEIYQQCQEFIDKFGDQFIGELKLETITLRQKPALLLPLLKNCLNASNSRLANPLSDIESTANSINIETELFNATKKRSGHLNALLFRYLIQWLRNGIAQREAMRFQRTRLFGLYRVLFLAVGHQWAQQGLIKEQRDIFFLSCEELLGYAEGRSLQSNWQALVDLRKNQYQQQQKMPELKRQFTTYGAIENNSFASMSAPVPHIASNRIQGKGCYPGVVEGRVRIILSPTDSMDLKDAILCTTRTDPGWTSLFIGLKGVIVEHGSLLSHSAILARELGIPTVVNATHATNFLKDGELVRMDGQTGEITRLTTIDDITTS